MSLRRKYSQLESKIYIDKHSQLVELCKRGDRKAQYELYRLYAKSMLNVCTRIVNDVATAEDVLQEAFIDAFCNLHSFKAESTFGAWFKQIVVNKAINHLRQQKMQWVDIENFNGENDENDIADSAGYDEEEVNWTVDKIKKGIEKLAEGYRVVLSLYLFEGYDHEEIGSILGISENTSRTQYIRGKKKLLEVLKNE